jgi:hypothetical protein
VRFPSKLPLRRCRLDHYPSCVLRRVIRGWYPRPRDGGCWAFFDDVVVDFWLGRFRISVDRAWWRGSVPSGGSAGLGRVGFGCPSRCGGRSGHGVRVWVLLYTSCVVGTIRNVTDQQSESEGTSHDPYTSLQTSKELSQVQYYIHVINVYTSTKSTFKHPWPTDDKR